MVSVYCLLKFKGIKFETATLSSIQHYKILGVKVRNQVIITQQAADREIFSKVTGLLFATVNMRQSKYRTLALLSVW